MKKIIFIGFITIIINVFYGCCGGFGASGTDCTNYKAKRQIFVTFNLDSNNNGFKLDELDATYGIIYEADSVNNFIIPIDTFVFVNTSILQQSKYLNMYQYEMYLIDNEVERGDYQLQKSLKIVNTNSNKVYEITNIEVAVMQNEKKCCQEYKDSNIKSYKLNGVICSGDNLITLNKK
jgi:hypothetical protein